MIKRPISPQFREAVVEGRKFTTIREKPWPVHIPIMLYSWSDKPYRSPQIDLTAVVVQDVQEIDITNSALGMAYWKKETDVLLNHWESEGFESQAAMDDWFRPLVKEGQTVTKFLMRFRLCKADEIPPSKTSPANPRLTSAMPMAL